MTVQKIIVSAPGKVILAGEHAVVHGFQGIWAAVDKRSTVSVQRIDQELKITSNHSSIDLIENGIMKFGEMLGKDVDNLMIKVASDVPVGSGMGSSAALAVALSGALIKYYNQPWELEKINEIAFEIEKIQHGKPSGGDNMVTSYGGFLKFWREKDGSPRLERITKYRKIENLILINSGKPKETTREMVNKVGELYESNRTRISSIFSRMEEIALEFYGYLTLKSEIDVGELFRENHRLLREIQVVSPRAEEMIKKIEHTGGASKISGAGGFLEGSGILLAFHKKPEQLVRLAESEGWSIIPVTLGAEGVRIE